MAKLANIYAPIAQLVEQLPFKETVVGSNPTGRTETKRLQRGVFLVAKYLE